MSARVAIGEEALDPGAIVGGLGGPGDGAVAVFFGTVRDHQEGRRVVRLEYQAYLPMARRCLRRIADDLQSRFEVSEVALLHRIGMLEVGEVSVVVAVSSPHRAAAFSACRHGIERIKAELPVWKKEHFADGEARWVPGCRPQDLDGKTGPR